jgi:hypothetical protein
VIHLSEEDEEKKHAEPMLQVAMFQLLNFESREALIKKKNIQVTPQIHDH